MTHRSRAPFGRASTLAYTALHGITPSEASGLVELRQPRETPTLVGVYRAPEAGLEDFGWATVCEPHGRLVIHDTRTLAEAHAAYPTGWCGICAGTEPSEEVIPCTASL